MVNLHNLHILRIYNNLVKCISFSRIHNQKKSSASDFSMRRSSHEAEYSDWMRKQNYMRDNKN